MKRQLLYASTLFLAMASTICLGQVSPKRGFAYGSNSMADITAMKAGISWWYNWSPVPDPNVNSSYATLGLEFVPMCWNGNINVTDFINNIKPGAKYLLGFNEPNLDVESNMTPEQAVANWPKVEQIAAAKNLEIVSAAAIYAGAGAVGGYTDPVKWHEKFFALCPTCKVDYIAFHTYEAESGGAIALTNNLAKFNKPIWVTEYADYHAGSDAEEKTYLQEVTSSYENNPDVFRYAWFTGRRADAPRINLLSATSGVLTDLGKTYTGLSYTSKKMDVPGRITANKHYRRKGTGLENTTDGGTGQNVCYIDPGDWAEFMLNVSTTGSYSMKFRVAAMAVDGKFDIQVNGTTVKTDVSFKATAGWQTWTDVPVTGITLPKGEVYLKIIYKTKEFNFNYIDVAYESEAKAVADFSASKTSVCIENNIFFTDQTTYKTGGETFVWNFGSGASPASATGVGPHTVKYTTGGQKTAELTVTNSKGTSTATKTNYINVAAAPTTCIFSDEFIDNTAKWLSAGAFSHSEASGSWKISNNGYGEWENFTYTLNNGTAELPINFACAAKNAILKVKAKASIAGKAALTATFVDANNRAIDNVSATVFELGTDYKTFTVDFTGKFKNIYSPTNAGPVDSIYIKGIQFSVNPGYASQYPVVGTSGNKYNFMYTGTIDIDWMGIGKNCDAPITIGIENASSANQYELYPNPFNDAALIKVNSNVTEKVSLKVIDTKGATVYFSDEFNTNENLSIGKDLENGIYTVLINHGNSNKAIKVVKIK